MIGFCIFARSKKEEKNMEFNFLKITFGKTTTSLKTSTRENGMRSNSYFCLHMSPQVFLQSLMVRVRENAVHGMFNFHCGYENILPILKCGKKEWH